MAARDDRRRLLIILLAALALRCLVFGDPVVHADEEFYFTVARAMAGGAVPYVDIWDRKPIGLFLLYLPAAALPWRWGVWAYQAMALASAVGTAALIARLADRAGWRPGATWAAVAYLAWLDLLGGVGGQSPVFYNLLMAGAGLLAARERPGLARSVGAMALVGCALQIKYAVVFEGVALGLWLLWRQRGGIGGTIGLGALLVATALLPTAAALAAYAAMGQADAFLYANFWSVLARGIDPPAELLRNAGILLLILSPLAAMTFGVARDGGKPLVRSFLRGWLVTAIAGVALFGSWFDHYGLPVLVPGCACAAGFFAHARWARARVAVLGLATLAGVATVAVNRANRGNGAQLDTLARAVGTGPGCLYVYSGTTMLYPATSRCALSRYVFPSHLGRRREAGAVGVDQAAEVRRILALRPAAVVMRRPYGGERPEIRAIIAAAVRRDYRRVAMLPMGREQVEVWRR